MPSEYPILFVEDSDADYFVATRALRKVEFPNPIHRCLDGDDALDYLFKTGAYASKLAAPVPGLILLDLNLPGTDGREVLQRIKSADSLKSIPVVVFTTSSNHADVDRCYRQGASSYIQKPNNPRKMEATARRVKEYWFETVRLPA